MYKTLITVALAGFAASAPARRQESGAFTIHVSDSGSVIQSAVINANGGLFWVGKPTLSSCPAEVASCPPGTATALVVSEEASGGAAMDGEVPGGQALYVAVDGALSYTVPHSGAIPLTATVGPFTYTPAPPGDSVGNFELTGKNFFACPTSDDDIYQIFAGVVGFAQVGCLDIGIFTFPYSGIAAWEYDF